jgi:hypothetical protein
VTGRRTSRPPLLEGTIANPDPEELTVLLDGFDGDRQVREEWAVYGINPRGHLLPARGDRCVVAQTDHRRYVVVWWDGAIPDPPPGPFEPNWQAPTFASGWTYWSATDPTFPRAGWEKAPDGTVRLRGIVHRTVSAWTPPQVMFTLPAGVRPGGRLVFSTVGYANGARGDCRVEVYANGNVELFASPGTWGGSVNLVGLDGISFWAEG